MERSDQTITMQVQPYRLTAGPLDKGLMVITQALKPIFPQRSGKISVLLLPMGEKELSYNYQDARIYGLSKWYRECGAQVGDYVSVTVLEPFTKYSFSITMPAQIRRQPTAATVPPNASVVKPVPIPTGAIFRDSLFSPHVFTGSKAEAGLEEAVIQNYRKMLGEGTLYLPIKKLIGSRLKKVTDGLLLDFNDLNHPRFWIVEIELSTHDLEDHIQSQMIGFLRALDDERTLRTLVKTVRAAIYKTEDVSDSWITKFFSPLWQGAGTDYEFLDNLLHDKCGLLIIIDKVTSDLEAIVAFLSRWGAVKVMEFQTFEANSERVHTFRWIGEEGRLSHEAKLPRENFKTDRTSGTNSATLRQILEVVAAMQHGKDYSEACRVVATARGVAVQTVRDKTTRRLGLAKAEFVKRLEDRTLLSLLITKYTRHKQEIESVLS